MSPPNLKKRLPPDLTKLTIPPPRGFVSFVSARSRPLFEI
jgi:hypothetical protein